MVKLQKYLKERAVQIALIAVIVKLVLMMLFSPSMSINLEELTTFVLFGVVIVAVAHFIASKQITMMKLFLIGFISIIVYNQGIAMLQLIGIVPFLQDVLVGIEMGLIVLLVGYLRGVRT